MNRYQLEPPEILRYEQTADDVVCFYIKRPYGALTNAVTRYRVRWKNGDSSEEWIRLFENPNATRLEIDGLKNGQSYEFYFESGSRVRFGKPLNFGKVVLQNWNERTLTNKVNTCKTLIGRLNDWAENTAVEITEKVFNENRMKMFKRRSSIFARLSNPIKFSSKVTRGIYIAFMAINHNEVLTTADEMLPLVRVDKFTTAVNDLLTKWLFRLPRSYCDLIIFQRMSEECTTDETSDNEISTERQILRTLILLLSLTCYKKFDYYHFAPVHFDEAAVIVVGASGPSEFVEGLQWTFLDSIGDDELKSQLLKIGQLNEELNRQLQPGLYVADFRLVSDVKQIYVKTSTQRPAFLPCAFIRPNPHMTSNEWSWLKVEANENSTDNTNGEQLEFYRKFFPAVDELLERHKYSTEYDDYCVYNDFLLEYGRVSMILIYPGPSKVVEFENVASKTMDLLTQLVPGSFFEREYLRQIAPLAFEKYAKVRSFIPMFKEIMKTNKTKERRFRIWHSSVQQNIADAEKMLSKFEAEVCWLKQIVSNARKAGPHLTSLRELQQRYVSQVDCIPMTMVPQELIGILCYTPNFLGSKTKPSRISVVITFPSLYPVGTTMLIQLKPETTAVEIVQLMMQRCFTKTQLKHMSANDFYLSILYGARERRLREAFEISALDEPWIDGEFCLKCCNTQIS
ncbi:Ras-associating domain-containing protein [Aphelenchoides besseyi]|nr:Ras-associating domain-containing protein [Aphelenchoides besseyi]